MRRKDDIPGSRVPEVYRAFVLGKDHEGEMERVIMHNRLDIMALMIMHADRQVEKIYS